MFPHVLSNAVTLPESRILTSPASLLLPQIPGYEVLEVLGHGGMGIVYKARHLALNRLVALKMLLPDCPFSQDQLERFLIEAHAVARFKHPNLVQIYDTGSHEGMPFLSLEYLEGGNLKDKLGGNPIPPTDAASMVETLARAVEYAHQKAIVHRDLKPANVLLTEDGILKIADFGLAKQIDEGAAREEDMGIVGTPAYMAPEQASGSSGEVGPRGDIYALGAILYEMLIGRPPFQGVSKMQTVELVRTQEPVPPRRVVPQVPRDLELICLKCLKKDQRDRFDTAQDLADELRRFLDGRPIKTRATPVWEHAWKWARRQPAVASLIAVCLVGLVGLGIYFAHEVERRTEMREQMHYRLEATQDAIDQKRIRDAKSHLEVAFEILRTDPYLSGHQPKLDTLREELKQQEAEQQIIEETEEKWSKFFRLRDTALFHGMVFTGVDLATSVSKTIEACQEALSLFKVTLSPPEGENQKGILPPFTSRKLPVSGNNVVGPVFPDYLSPLRRKKCTEACYELLLVWAEAVAQPGANQQEAKTEQLYDSLRLLDRAALLGLPPTGAFHLRRESYLRQLNLLSEAREESALAKEARSETALDHFLTGISRQKEGRLKDAAETFEEALRKQPDHFWATYFLGICNLQMQNPALASNNFTSCMKDRPDFLYLYLYRGFANGQLNNFQKANEDYQKARQALERKPDQQALYGLLVNQGVLDFRKTQRPETSCLVLWPQPVPNLSFACQGTLEVLRRKELLESAAHSLEKAIELKKDQYTAYRYYSLVLQQQKRFDDALLAISNAIKHSETIEPRDRMQVQEQLRSQRSRLYREKGNLDASLKDLGTSAEDCAERGRILYAQKRYTEAVSSFEASLKQRTTEVDVIRWKAQALQASRRESEALAAFEEYLNQGGSPTAEIYRTCGRIRVQMKDFPSAISDYTQALKLQPDSVIYAARGWLFLGNESVTQALQDFDQAIRLNTGNAEAYAGRGFIRARQSKQALAVADAETALLHGRPKTPRLLWNVTHIYSQLVSSLDAQPGVRNRQELIQRAVNLRESNRLLQEALDLVPQAEQGDFWRRYVIPDGLLTPLRGTLEFEEMDRRYRGK